MRKNSTTKPAFGIVLRMWESKALCLLFVLVLAVCTGCSKGDNSNKGGEDNKETTQLNAGVGGKGNGRFLESEVVLPGKTGRILTLAKLKDGSLEVVTEGKEEKSYYILKSNDQGKHWEEIPIKGVPKTHIPYAAVSPDGSVAMIPYAKKSSLEIYFVDAKRKTNQFGLQLPGNEEKNQIRQAAYDKKGTLFARDLKGSLLAVDLKKGTCKVVFDTNGIQVNYFGIVGNEMLAVHDKGIQIFNMEKKDVPESEIVLDDLIKKDKKLASSSLDSGAPMVFSEGTEDGGIVFANGNGLFHFNRGGSVTEQLVDASLTSLGSGGIVLLDLVTVDQNNFWVAANDNGEYKLLQYSYDSNAASVPNKEITVYALDESSFLRKVVNMFQKQHPDTYVKLEFGLSDDDGVTLEDALSVLSTNILADKGPDVLILDGLPVDSYIKKGILSDISDVVEEIDESDGLLPKIKESSKNNGKIYAFPVRFLLSVIEGDSETIKSAGSLSGLAERAVKLKKGSDQGVIPESKGTLTLLRDLYYADSASWMTEDNTIDKKALTDYLSSAKQIYDVDSNGKEHDFHTKMGSGTIDGVKVGTLTDSELIEGNSKMSMGTLVDFWSLQNMVSSWQLTKSDYGLLNHEKVKSYIPYLSVGVTESGNKEAAKEFLKILLGKKANNSPQNGFPSNKAAFDLLCKEKMDSKAVKDDGSISFSTEDEKNYNFNMVNLTKQQIDQFTTFVESLEKPAMDNRIILDIVLEQGDKLLLGEQNLKDTVDTILKKVNLYLAENN
ncbi:MAG: extracellular solute-binding protein [Lachnospiraceae bacterium]|nr:extracellular solute-binding protein [Lachnospiraceae bacterium]